MWNRLVKQQAHLRIGAPWLPREPLSQPLWRQRGSPPESPQAMNFLQGSRRGSARVYLQCAQFSWNLDLWGITWSQPARAGRTEEAYVHWIKRFIFFNGRIAATPNHAA